MPEHHQLWKTDKELFNYFSSKYENGISYTPGSTPNAPELILNVDSSELNNNLSNSINNSE